MNDSYSRRFSRRDGWLSLIRNGWLGFITRLSWCIRLHWYHHTGSLRRVCWDQHNGDHLGLVLYSPIPPIFPAEVKSDGGEDGDCRHTAYEQQYAYYWDHHEQYYEDCVIWSWSGWGEREEEPSLVLDVKQLMDIKQLTVFVFIICMG